MDILTAGIRLAYTHFGYADVEIDKLENYYDTVKMQSNDKIIPFKSA